MQDACAFVSIHGPQFAVANRKIPIAPQTGLINHDVVRAVHRLELIFAALDLHGCEHVFTVVIDVPAGFPKIESRDVGRIDQLVPVLNVLLTPEVLDEEPDCSSFGMPEDETGTDFILNGDEIQFLSHFPMVAPLDFFQAV